MGEDALTALLLSTKEAQMFWGRAAAKGDDSRPQTRVFMRQERAPDFGILM